jgi:hypothetical protein
MREVWIGHYVNRPFRVTVKFGKIVRVEGELPWAKGMRIRHFKRTIWKNHSYVERERIPEDTGRTIEVSPQVGETEKEVECIGPNQEEIEQAPGEILRVVDGLRICDPVPKVQPHTRLKAALPKVRPRRVIPSGMNRRNALQYARQMGCKVHHVNRTGEVRITHPSMAKSVLINNRRKDAPRALTTFLTQLQALDSS